MEGGEFHARCAADRDQLLELVRKGGFRPRVPAAALLAVIRLLGWRLICTALEDGLHACLDIPRREVLTSWRHADPKKACQERANVAIGHELGHIRLHLPELELGVRTDQQEDEADVYARVFLLPERDVLRGKHLLQLERQQGRGMWNTVAAMARWWEVTPGMMTIRLRELGYQERLEPRARAKSERARTGQRLRGQA